VVLNQRKELMLDSLAYAEMRLILAKVLWHFDLELVRPKEDWLGMQKVFALWDKGSLGVRLTAVER
jgi:cytochrome P450